METIGRGVLDDPLEPVIGLAEGETRWLASGPPRNTGRSIIFPSATQNLDLNNSSFRFNIAQGSTDG
ncbi:MAG: hypothetical protein QOF94_2053 [Acidobacteriaceae bacterium]|jgi:hypothetical protein